MRWSVEGRGKCKEVKKGDMRRGEGKGKKGRGEGEKGRREGKKGRREGEKGRERKRLLQSYLLLN